MSSPRKSRATSTTEQKREKKDQIRLDKAGFQAYIREIASMFKLIIKLNVRLTEAKVRASEGKTTLVSGVALKFTDKNGRTKELTGKDLNNVNLRFAKTIEDLGKYFGLSKKKNSTRVRASQLAGIYTPVFLGPALTNFFNYENANFGPISPMYASMVEEGDENIDQYLADAFDSYQSAKIEMDRAAQEATRAQLAFTRYDEQISAARQQARSAGREYVESDQEANNLKQLYKEALDAQTAYYKVEDVVISKSIFMVCNDPKPDAIKQCLAQPLMDYLPLLKEGYTIRNTLNMLLHIYADANGLQDEKNGQFIVSDDFMNAAFYSDTPSLFVQPEKKSSKVRSSEYNTYQAILLSHGPENYANGTAKEVFNPERFKTFFYQCITSLNYFSKKELLADPEYAQYAARMDDPHVREGMVQEHNLIKSVKSQWKDLLGPARKARSDQKKKDAAASAAASGTTKKSKKVTNFSYLV